MDVSNRPQELVQANLENPKSTQGIFDLPCGYLASDGVLHTEVAIREMTGAEEDLLASTHMKPLKKYGELLARCVTRLGTLTDKGQLSLAVKNLTVGDRIFLLFAIRRVTLGDEYPFNEECPNEACKKMNLYTINLADLEVKKMPEPAKRVYDLNLPSGGVFRFRVSTGADEERVDKFSGSEDAASLGILMRTELLNGEPPDLAKVKSMKWKDRQFIRKEWEKVEGGLDTGLDMQCPSCGAEFKRSVQVGGSFFFP